MAKKTKTYELKNEAGAGIRIRFRPENAYFLEQTTGKTFIEDEDTRRLMRECFGRYMAQFRKLGDGEVLAELRLGGEEMLSASFPYSTHGRKLPAKETAGYREKLKELETLGRDPGASERLRTIAERFPVARLENDPELFRVYRRDGEWRLAVIWGLTGVAGDTLRPVNGAQAPNPTGGASAFAARLLPWLVALLIALLALLAWHEFGKNTVEGPDTDTDSTGGPTNPGNVENGGDDQGENQPGTETTEPRKGGEGDGGGTDSTGETTNPGNVENGGDDQGEDRPGTETTETGKDDERDGSGADSTRGTTNTGNGENGGDGQGENPGTGDDAEKPKELENPNANKTDKVAQSGIDNSKNEGSEIRTGTQTTVPTSPIPPQKDGEEGRNGDDGTGRTTNPGKGKNDGGDNPSPHPEAGEGSPSNTGGTGETAGAGNGENNDDVSTTSDPKNSETPKINDVGPKSAGEISNTPTPSMNFPVTARRKEDGRVVLETPEGIGENQKIAIYGEDGRELGSTDGKSGDYEIPNVSADVKKLSLVGFDKNGKKTGDKVVSIEEIVNPPPPPPGTIRGGIQTNSGIGIEYTRRSDAEKGELFVHVTAQGKRVREIEYDGKSYPATDNAARIPDVSKDAADTKIVIHFDNGTLWTEDFKEALK